MPIYEYQCPDCGHELEAIQKMSDSALTDCPECKGNGLKKRISAPGFRLSGSGWYETDFKTGKKKNLAKQDSDSGSAAKSDSKKPAAPSTPSAS
ncbi:zinc ribbon domain-containing protein [Ketobacter sp. MCCC 1A13808]|uniref:FmdB family zinc ribbon protein n=1 Tax=Ketobacter sp. MCCC 1A13808 TaxID=2602738 RepID=UPI000F2701FE|nr:zinc ribbon domain-containing protein [Ketobacter sp. MCCC 1A13808]MVF10757.1 zinc ribbon domain-containing protein [Ketobacter sp. MCCC 1A13808]RLP56171.1 MAG: zinc ribbon domain-containing protein [Ketobacter sp.]